MDTTISFDLQVLRFKIAKANFENSRLGSVKGIKGEATMTRLVAWAERNDVLAEFVQAMTK